MKNKILSFLIGGAVVGTLTFSGATYGQDNLNDVRGTIDLMKTKIVNLDKSVKNYETAYGQLVNQSEKDIENKVKAIASLEEQITELENQLSIETANSKELKAQLDSLNKEKSKLEREKAELVEKNKLIPILEEENEQALKELKDLNKEIKDLEDELEEANSYKDNNIKSVVKEAQAEINRLEGELEKANKDTKKTIDKINNSYKQVENLGNEVITVNDIKKSHK
jgi:chromosome segregation ATPase